MKTIAAYVAEILTVDSIEERRRALDRVPRHLRNDVEKRVRELWKQRDKVKEERKRRSFQKDRIL